MTRKAKMLDETQHFQNIKKGFFVSVYYQRGCSSFLAAGRDTVKKGH